MLAEDPQEAAAALDWLKSRLASKSVIADDITSGVAGSTNIAMLKFNLHDGGTLEVWSDNYYALSLRGEAALVNRLATEYRALGCDG